jgi:hypothetical protein
VPDPGPCPQSVTQMLVDRHQATLTAMSRARTADPAVPCRTEETDDDQVLAGRGEIEVAEVGRDWRKMADRRRLRRSWTLRWKIIGERRRMALRLRVPRLRMTLT